MIDTILTNTLLQDVSRELLQRGLAGKPALRAKVGVAERNFSYVFE